MRAWGRFVVEESSAKTVVLGSMQREGVDDSQSEASDSAGNDETTNGLNNLSSNTIPAAAPPGAAGTLLKVRILNGCKIGLGQL